MDSNLFILAAAAFLAFVLIPLNLGRKAILGAASGEGPTNKSESWSLAFFTTVGTFIASSTVLVLLQVILELIHRDTQVLITGEIYYLIPAAPFYLVLLSRKIHAASTQALEELKSRVPQPVPRAEHRLEIVEDSDPSRNS